MSLSRREFLRAGAATALVGAATALGVSLHRLRPSSPPVVAASLGYGDWRDVYRQRWSWDRVACGTHTNVNCVSSCAWNLYVRDGIVWREEQSAPYIASNAEVPDWNPRGCQKGASCSDLMTSSARLRHPLKQIGGRGSGKFRRVSWDEALGEIASGLVDTLAERGGEGVVLELGPNVDYGANTAAGLRFFRQIGAPITDSMAQIGDLAVGGTITLGTPHTDGSSDDWFRSKYLVLWACNPATARIPDAHFVNEARYNGARVVVVAPDYNQSSIHADCFVPVRPGTDAALALAACQLVIEEGLYDEEYLLEQTDLPFLIRADDGRFLREADVVRGGRSDVFAWWDGGAAAPAWAPGCAGSDQRSLRVPDGVMPQLDVRAEVTLLDGRRTAVRTAFSLLRERLASAEPEAAAGITGLSAGLIRRFGREFAAADSALILSQWGMCKNYHSDLAQRSQILLASLTGNLGRAGGGWRSGAFVALDGMGLVAMQDRLGLPSLAWTAARSMVDPKALRAEFESMYIPSTIFHAVHGGLAEFETAAAHGDPGLERGAAPYLEEALQKGHFPISPPPGERPPDVVFSLFGNVLRHTRMGWRVRETLFSSARLVVDINFRLNETGRHADFLLPAAGWYEKVGIKYIASFVPYLTLGDRAVAPLGESKPEWEIFSLLAQQVGSDAERREITQVRGFRGQACSLGDLGERFSDSGRFGPRDEEAIAEFILGASGASKGIDLATLRKRGGAMRISSLGSAGGTAGIYSDYDPDEPVVPLRDFVEKKHPYPTLTGRQQFYIDHPWFLEVGEELPMHKAPPASGGAHPFTLTGGHTRWSVHAMWRDQDLMLRLQRGEPVIYLNETDAGARGIRDHGLVRVFNDLGEFVCRAKLTGAIQPRQAHIFHAWEPYQFRGGRCHQSLAPSPFKITQLVGDYGQLHWGYSHYEPNQVDRDTRVDLAPLPETA